MNISNTQTNVFNSNVTIHGTLSGSTINTSTYITDCSDAVSKVVATVDGYSAATCSRSTDYNSKPTYGGVNGYEYIVKYHIPQYINTIVVTGAGVPSANGTYTRASDGATNFTRTIANGPFPTVIEFSEYDGNNATFIIRGTLEVPNEESGGTDPYHTEYLYDLVIENGVVYVSTIYNSYGIDTSPVPTTTHTTAAAPGRWRIEVDGQYAEANAANVPYPWLATWAGVPAGAGSSSGTVTKAACPAPAAGGTINTAGGAAGAGGSINLSNRGGSITMIGNAGEYDGTEYPSVAGSINLSAGAGGNGGSIILQGSPGADEGNKSSGGSINLSAGVADGSAGGSIISTGNNEVGGRSGGTLNMSNAGGNINTAGSDSNSEEGGDIDTSGGDYGPGGSINTSDNGGSINTSGNDGGTGGSINTAGNDGGTGGSINTSGDYDGAGGSINTSGGRVGDYYVAGGNINTSLGGGAINTSGGADGTGGSINTSNDGGSINTRGVGSIQLGNDGTRTTLNGSAAGFNKTITIPNANGTIALQTDVSKNIADSLYNSAGIVITNIKFRQTLSNPVHQAQTSPITAEFSRDATSAKNNSLAPFTTVSGAYSMYFVGNGLRVAGDTYNEEWFAGVQSHRLLGILSDVAQPSGRTIFPTYDIWDTSDYNSYLPMANFEYCEVTWLKTEIRSDLTSGKLVLGNTDRTTTIQATSTVAREISLPNGSGTVALVSQTIAFAIALG